MKRVYSFLRILLLPFCFPYLLVISLRNLLFSRGIISSYQSKLPVLCCGSATAGGSGKTPFTRFVAKELLAKGKKPAILLRGYRGSTIGPHMLSEADCAESVGDEAIEHYRALKGQVPIVVCAKRSEGAKFLEKQGSVDVVVLDDGYQHLALKRDVNFLLYNISENKGERPYGGDYLLPAGNLREPLSFALTRASLLVRVSHQVSSGVLTTKNKTFENGIQEIDFFLTPKHFVDLANSSQLPLSALVGKNVVAFGALAKNELFFSLLEELGLTIVRRYSYPDHCSIDEEEWAEIVSAANCPIVCTQKDAAKLSDYVTQKGSVYSLVLQGDIPNKADKKQFNSFLDFPN